METIAGVTEIKETLHLPFGDVVHLTKQLHVPTDTSDCSWGASVLPFAVLPNGNVFFLLGRENVWKDMAGEGQWCAFGGQHECNEHEVAAVAARECAEETCGVLNPNVYTMTEQLRQKLFYRKVEACINYGSTADSTRKYYFTYAVQVPYQFDVGEQFQRKVSRLRVLQDLYFKYVEGVCGLDLNVPTGGPIVGRNGVIAMQLINLEEQTFGTSLPAFEIETYTCPTEKRATNQSSHICLSACMQTARREILFIVRDSPAHRFSMQLANLHREQLTTLLMDNFHIALRRTYDVTAYEPVIPKTQPDEDDDGRARFKNVIEPHSATRSEVARSASDENLWLVQGVPCVSSAIHGEAGSEMVQLFSVEKMGVGDSSQPKGHGHAKTFSCSFAGASSSL